MKGAPGHHWTFPRQRTELILQRDSFPHEHRRNSISQDGETPISTRAIKADTTPQFNWCAVPYCLTSADPHQSKVAHQHHNVGKQIQSIQEGHRVLIEAIDPVWSWFNTSLNILPGWRAAHEHSHEVTQERLTPDIMRPAKFMLSQRLFP